MYNIEVPATIKQIIAVFHRLGVWRKKEESKYCKWARRSAYTIFQFTFLLSLGIGAYHSDDMNDSMLLGALVLQCSVLTAKMVYILLKEQETRQFIYDMGVYTIHDHGIYIIANRKLKRLMNFAQFFVGMSFVAGVLLLIFPLISYRKTLPLNLSFPLNWKTSDFSFSVAYIYMLLEIVLNGSSSLLTIFIWFLMINCSIQYRNLGSQFRNSGLRRTTTTTVEISQQQARFSEGEKPNLFLLDLIGSIKAHRSIQEKVTRFKRSFSSLFMAQILTSGVCICGSVYVLAFSSTNENLIVPAFNLMLLIYNTFDIFMILYFGNEIKLESDQLSHCLFESNWIDEPTVIKKNMGVLMEVLKQPQKLIICKLYPLNLETFTSILKVTYSIFNILKNFK